MTLKSRIFSTIKSALDATVVKVLRYLKVHTSIETDRSLTVHRILADRAAISSADYIEKHLGEALLFPTRERLWDFALSRSNLGRLFAEFGVYKGESINYFAESMACKDVTIFGFDSFEGLKEDWPGSDAPAGTFDLGGAMPAVLPNVQLVKGWFDATVPAFLQSHPNSFGFLHLDADTYQSTRVVLDLLKERIVPGTVIVFDEYIGLPNWQNGEFLAWREFCEERNLSYRYLGFSTRQACVQVS